jgi:hypothetical protein
VTGRAQEVIVEALDKVDLEYRIDDGPWTKMSLAAAQIHTFKAKGKVQLQLSDGGLVNIVHNGKDRGVPGDMGKPAKVNFP